MTEFDAHISIRDQGASVPVRRASFLHRFFAFSIDLMILGIAGSCVNTVVGFMVSPGGSANAGEWSGFMWWIISLVIPAVYFIWPYSTDGQTTGKRALKIKVVSIDGSPLNWRKGLLRSVGYLLSAIPLNLGYLWALWDPDKQAGHDKIAGTCVVPASVPRGHLRGAVEPREIQRTRGRWLLGLGIPAVLVLVGIYFWIQRGVAEVRDMAPWPGTDVSPQEVVTVDLSNLGLESGQILNARDDEAWSGGSYQDGALIIYESGTESIVAVWALRYEDKAAASGDYSSAQTWAAGNCGLSRYAYLGNSGIIHCQFREGVDKIFWNDYWIIDIFAREVTEYTPDILVDQVRDALAAHWKTGLHTP